MGRELWISVPHSAAQDLYVLHMCGFSGPYGTDGSSGSTSLADDAAVLGLSFSPWWMKTSDGGRTAI